MAESKIEVRELNQLIERRILRIDLANSNTQTLNGGGASVIQLGYASDGNPRFLLQFTIGITNSTARANASGLVRFYDSVTNTYVIPVMPYSFYGHITNNSAVMYVGINTENNFICNYIPIAAGQGITFCGFCWAMGIPAS